MREIVVMNNLEKKILEVPSFSLGNWSGAEFLKQKNLHFQKIIIFLNRINLKSQKMKTKLEGFKVNVLSLNEKASVIGGNNQRLQGDTGRDQRLQGDTGRDQRLQGDTGRDNKR